jgi:CubicO group peptidase (beta-lactamase class C family)
MAYKGSGSAWKDSLVIAAVVALATGYHALAETEMGEAGPLDPRLAEIRSGIVEKVDSGELPSLAVAVYADGKMIWEEAIGWADKENKLKATTNSIYGLGSLSKSITATGLMVLVERGLVDLDAPINDYLGEQKLTVCVDTDDAITVRHLLTCSAGIPHGWYGYVLGDEPSFAAGDEYVRRFGLVAFPPRQRFLYSNHAYGMTREIIARVSGQSFEEFMRKEVFEPLGMRSSGLGIVTTDDDVALGYYGDVALPKSYVTGPVGGATLFSSVSDLMRYARFHLGKPPADQKAIFGKETLEAMHSGRDETLAGSWMALGWGAIDMGEHGRRLLSNGEVTGANATVLLLPDKAIAIVCLANKAFSPSISDATAFAIADVLVPGFEEQMEELRSEFEALYGGEYEVTDELLGPWQGQVKSADGTVPLTLLFQADGDIHVRVGDGLRTLLDRTRLSNGLIAGSCVGSLPAPENFDPGQLMFYLAPGKGEIAGYLQWRTEWIDGEGESWSMVLPGCVSLTKAGGDDSPSE